MKKTLFWLIILSLVAIAAFTSYRYISLVYENNKLNTELRASQFYATNLQDRLNKQKEQYNNLLKDMEALEAKLKDGQTRLDTAHKELSSLDEKIAMLKQENASLTEKLNLATQEKAEIQAKLDAATQEKAALEEKFNSMESLKQAIKDLRGKMRQARQLKPGHHNSDVTLGNRGYVILNGKPTHSSSQVKIEVSPIP